ncbi:MAG: topoisomerase DNA-binding C4 zinc finger domain-containing protein [Candidatus Thiodiazotropha sp. (ex Lucinoma aequizonata)]|nr:topoisomerase DNA-binding C4 zinc finger domain-containing protein [Candidatus Thiodiazotropha sp. (ex Lucinoma aequizonata)]MCU7895447.1 topoisomerase DNA-binding C4 zinc finger domain-containing protein [Candidatus Thiodiazotropha sp. (ex Lucinoma aequizonata)]MCU7899076.1 topoisomerase DNA-binding C4 zinc finger domain-containing protein [Candidatus Thiodiazotropha sp. (ex Lucinoma aequizonata)]MCU7903795.1 topoisomerase DNA-binding C4 zinc finger domain-containing protein [Candidatus Thio
MAFPDKDGKPDLAKPKRPAVVSNFKCEDCGEGLIRRKRAKRIKGKVFYFWTCSAYPDCESIYFDRLGKPSNKSVKK